MASKNNPIHFNISSSVVRQLGLELVTDEVTAIMELVKNAYDADASRVAIEINTVDVLSEPGLFYEYKSPGYIIIDDTGFGMDLADIVNGWLVISLSAKRSMKAKMVRTPKGRIPLGEKGLGRLSTQKLGDRIEMITGKVGEASNTHVAFSWNDFSDDMPITEIRPYVNEISKNQKLGGTKIIISNLTSPQAWESKSLNRFRGQLSQLIFPIKEKRPFQVYLKVNNVNYDLDELSENVRKTAISSFNFSYDGQKLKVEGRIKASRLSGATGNDIKEALEKLVNRDSGREFYQFLTDRKLNKQFALSGSKYIGEKGQLFSFERTIQIDDISGLLSDAGNLANGFADPGRFSGEIDEYFFSDDAALGSAFDSYSDLKTIVQNQAGVRIYRDGFGIKPYGIGNDDWLNLGGGQTSGPSFYGMRPKNVIGFVSISSEFNGVLKEKTDREGLMEDSFSLNFFALMARVTKEINTVLLKTRRSFNEFRSKRAEEIGGFKSIGDTFNVIQTAARSED